MTRTRIASTCLLLAALAIVGCSGDDDDNTAATPTSSASSSTSTAQDTTSVPPNGTGTTTGGSTGVASTLLPPVGIGEPAELARDLFATVTDVESTTFTAQGPGQTSGPGVIATVELRNDTAEAIDLAGLVVNAHYGEGRTPAVPNTVLGGALEGSLAPGERRSGKYGFRIAEGEASSVVFDIQHSSAPNVAIVFTST